MEDIQLMQQAIALAKKGKGHVNPNPLVGAVLVKDGTIIGKGYHEQYGQLHAERNALKDCKVSPEGAVLYVTLEPCNHHGKTPPCTEAIIENGIAKVVIGTLDPNPQMAVKSVKILQEHGIEVVVGMLEEECKDLIRVFRKYITTGRPYVLMKYAMTMDGKIATYTGASKWITGEKARACVQETRNEFSGIMVGVNTVLKDDPSLTCRMENGRNPIVLSVIHICVHLFMHRLFRRQKKFRRGSQPLSRIRRKKHNMKILVAGFWKFRKKTDTLICRC